MRIPSWLVLHVGCALVLGMMILGVRLDAQDIVCLDGKILKDVLSIRANPDSLTITTATGITGVLFTNLPEAICKQYGYDVFEAGFYHASHMHPTTNHLTDAFSIAQLEQAKAKALSTGKCVGFIVVWGSFFAGETNPSAEGSSNALAQFTECFKESLVLVFVRHETELGNAPEAARKGLFGPDEGGWAPSMAVTDPTLTDYICEIPLGGPHADGAARLKVFRTGIDRIKAYLAAHGTPPADSSHATTASPPADTPTAQAPAATTPAQPAASSTTDPVAPPVASTSPSSPVPPPTVSDGTAPTTTAPAAIPATTPQAGGVAENPAAGAEPAPPTRYQEVTLVDGRILKGQLDADRTTISLINLKTGKAEGSMPITPEQVASVVEKTFVPEQDPLLTLTPAERQLARSERNVLYCIRVLNQAKQLSADTIEEDRIWDRTKRVPQSQSESDMLNARLDNLHHRMTTTAAAIPVAKAAYDQALAAYKKLGGIRDFSSLLKDPPAPK